MEGVLFEKHEFLSEVDDGELLFLADVELLDEFVMDFEEFIL